MGSGSDEGTFEFDGHTFRWPSRLDPDDMLAACVFIFLDLASRAHRGDALAAELLSNSPIRVIRTADGRAYWPRRQPDGGNPRPPDPVARDGARRGHGRNRDAEAGPGEREAARGKGAMYAASRLSGSPGGRDGWRGLRSP